MRTKSWIGPAAVLLVAGSILAPALFADAKAPLVGDATVSSSSPSTNFGTGTTLNIAPGSAGLVQFDLSGFSPGTRRWWIPAST